MRNAQPVSVKLPRDMAAMVKAKVASGEYASKSDVIRGALRALQARSTVVLGSDEELMDLGVRVPPDILARLRVRPAHSPKIAKRKR
jgi:putative addiction module CopG family antidote